MRKKNLALLSFLILFLLFRHAAFAQVAGKQVPIKTPATASSENALLYLPWDYDISGKKYPLILFGHGISETTVGSLSNQGLPGIIAQNNPPYAIENGDTVRFIVLSITGQSFIGENEMSNGAKDLIARGIRIDADHIYVTGLSAGARSTVGYISHQDASNYQRVAAAVPMSYTLTVDEMDGGYWVGSFSNFAGKGVWAFTGKDDVHTDVATALVDSINIHSPGNGRLTVYPGGHCCWMTYYDPKYRESVNGKMMNIYEWMLQYSTTGNSVPPPANQTPVAKAGNDQNITLPLDSVALDASASSDPDGSIASYKWVQKSGPAVASIQHDNASKTIVNNLVAGTYVFTLTVTDDKGATATDDVSVVVNDAANQTPVANAGNDQNITLPLDSVVLDASASSDPDGSIASYQWTQKSGPATASIQHDNASETIVNNLVAGTYVFTLTVTDDKGAAATDDISVVVNDAINQTPVANAGNDQTITLPLDSVALDAAASSDPDGSIASYKWVQKSGPAVASIQNANASKTIVNNLVAGTYVFTLTVTDDKGATATDDISVVVNDATNQTPVANAGNDQTITLPLDSVALDASASSDPDGSIASYKWTQKSGPAAAIIQHDNASETIVNNLVAGTYVFTLTVTDDKGATATDDVSVVVNDAANQTPVANAGNDQNITLPLDSVVLDASTSSDPDGSIASYQWTQKSGPAAASIQHDNASETIVNNLVAGTYVFTLTVTDDKGATASDDVNIVVQDEPEATTGNNGKLFADGGPDITTVMPLNKVTLDGSKTKDENKNYIIISYKWEKISGPDQYTIQFPTKAATDVQNLAVGTYTFKFTVTINTRETASDTVKVVVEADPAQPGDVPFTANTQIPPYNTLFQYGTNTGYYGNGWSDSAIAGIASKAGANSIRLNLPDYFVAHYGYDIRVNEFNYYTHDLGMKDIALFVDRPRDEYREDSIYAPSTTQSKIFGHLYQPIWDNGENGTPINDDNYFAVYIYNLVKRYGKNIKFWEIVNEADATGFWDNGNRSRADSWYNAPPSPDALNNMKAPVFSYIRMLRIAYEIIKKYDPQSYITTGGLGYPAFLDALLRYTDNPDQGKPTQDYPLTGGAYFDVVSFHDYPAYSMSVWDNSIGGFRQLRYSDKAADAMVDLKNQFDDIQKQYGYDGTKYPKKPSILTEINIPRKTFNTYFGSEEAQRNFIIKALVEAQQYDIKQLYVYQIGEAANYDNATDAYQLMGLYENLSQDQPGQEKLTSEGTAFKTTSMLLYGWSYDSVRTKALNLPSTIAGAAFKKGDTYRYVLWARTNTDLSEVASASYTFPSSFGLSGLYRYEWNYAADPKATSQVNAQNIALTGAPSFFAETQVVDTVNRPPVADAGNNQTISLPTNSVTLNGTASMDPDGIIASYKWTKTAGPASFTFDNANSAETKVSGLVAGVYTFTLTVTDNRGVSDSDRVTVTVNAVANSFPIANAGTNQTITLPTNSATLNGSASSDPDGSITAYKWTKKSGPASYTFDNSTAANTKVSGLVAGTYVFTLTVTDNSGSSTSSDVTIIVKEISNKVPVANAGADQSITLPANSVTLNGSASSDPDGSITAYKWTKKSGPASFNINNAGIAKPELTNLVAGIYNFTLTVTDDKGASASDEVVITVNAAPNQTPVVKIGENQTITLPLDSVKLDGSASADPDGNIASYLWTKKSGPASFNINDNKAAKTTVTDLVAGTYIFMLTVTDNNGATASGQVTITVNPAVNQSPTAHAGNDTTITLPLDSVQLDGSASADPDGTISSYKWSKKSGPASFNINNANSATTEVSGLVEGTYVFTLTVTDNNGATASDDMTVNVKNIPNQLPVALAGNDTTITLPTDSIQLDGSNSTDPDGSIASYHWTEESGPEAYSIHNAGAAQTLVSGLQQGQYVFMLTVTDNQGASSTDAMVVTVLSTSNTNKIPSARAGNDQTITLPQDSALLDGSASSDPDGSIVSYQWSKESGPADFSFTHASDAKTQVSNLEEGTYVFTLTVTDDQGAKAIDHITITVKAAPNQLPVANAGTNSSTTLPKDSVVLDGSASADPDGTVVDYKWSKKSGPAPYNIHNENAAQTIVSGLVAGTYVFTLTVTDDHGATASSNVTITVKSKINQAPVANTGASRSITLPKDSVVLDGSASEDPDGSIVSYQWTQQSGPAHASFSDSSADKTSVSGLVAGTYVFSLTVTDNQGATASSEVTITVEPAKKPANSAPVARAGNDVEITLPVNSATLDGTASSDPDGSIVSYQWKMKSGPAAAAIAADSTASTQVSDLEAGIYVFTLTVTDNQGATATDNVTITVYGQDVSPNQVPIADPGQYQTIKLPLDSVILDGSASYDPDGSIFAYQWKMKSGPVSPILSNPAGVKTRVTGLVAGKYVFTLIVTDNEGMEASADVIVIVNPMDEKPNQAPRANAGNDQTITLPISSVTLDGAASGDPDGTLVSYHWTKKSGPSSYHLEDEKGIKTQVDSLVVGTYIFTLTVTDNKGATASDDVTITVNKAPNKPPVANAGNAHNVFLPNSSTTLDGSASADPDGNIATYQWTQKSGPSNAVFSHADAAKAQVSGLVNGVYVFTLTVTDNEGASASADVTIGVYKTPNESPVANAGNNITIVLPQDSTILDGSASYDPDGEIASYHWEVVSGSGQITLTQQDAPQAYVSGLQEGTYGLKLTVTDNKGATASAIVNVTVLPAQDSTEREFRIYPNPVHDELHVKLSRGIGGVVWFRITDIQGRIVKTYNLGQVPAHYLGNLNVSDLPQGTYFIQLIQDTQLQEVRKMIKY